METDQKAACCTLSLFTLLETGDDINKTTAENECFNLNVMSYIEGLTVGG